MKKVHLVLPIYTGHVKSDSTMQDFIKSIRYCVENHEHVEIISVDDKELHIEVLRTNVSKIIDVIQDAMLNSNKEGNK